MTASTVLEISAEDLPLTLLSGTKYGRKKYHVRVFNASTSYTLNLATYDPVLTSIEGYEGYVLDGAKIDTVPGTWSTTTFTFTSAGTAELTIYGYYS